MAQYYIYLLVPVMAALLVSAQAMWGLAIKNQHLLDGSVPHVITNLVSSYKMWLGALLYVAATLVYFVMLSRGKFFVIQVSMTAAAILLSTLLAVVLFNEKISAINIVGTLFVLIGLSLVLAR